MKKRKKQPDAKPFQVAIFGSARIKKNDLQYKRVYDLAKKIAFEGIDIVTGGGPGLMDAACRGHHAGRKKRKIFAIGLSIHLPHEQMDSWHLDIQEEFDDFAPRLDEFMRLSDVVVVAPGGIGTLLELIYTWQLIQVKKHKPIPIILYDKMWSDFIRWIRKWPLKKRLMKESDLDMIHIARTEEEVLSWIRLAHINYKQKQ